MPKKATVDNTNDIISSVFQDDSQMVAFSDTSLGSIKDWLPTLVPSLDAVLTGGIPLSGRLTEIFGEASVGKSTLVMNLLRIAQKFGIIVIYFDVELTVSRERLEELGVDSTKVITRQPKKLSDGTYAPLTVEEIMDTMITYSAKIKKAYPNAMTLFIWDTIADTDTENALEKELASQQKPGGQAKALTEGLRKLNVNLVENNASLIALNQARDSFSNVLVQYKSKVTTGGNAWQHGMSLRLQLKQGASIYNNTTERISIGHEVKIKFVKSKVASNTAQLAKGYFLQNTGFDIEYNMFEEAKALKWIVTSGRSSKYINEDGEIVVTKVTKEFVPYLKSEEGKTVCLDLWTRLIKYYFKYCYPPLFNIHVQMTEDKFPRSAELREYYTNIQENLPLEQRDPLYREYCKVYGTPKTSKVTTNKVTKGTKTK